MSLRRSETLQAIKKLLRLGILLGLALIVFALFLIVNLLYPFFQIQPFWSYLFIAVTLLSGLIALFISTHVSSYIKNEIVIPLNLLSKTAEKILEEETYHYPDKHPKDDEIGDFVERFNNILHRAVANEKEFAKKVLLASQTASKAEHMMQQLQERANHPALFNVIPLSLFVVNEDMMLLGLNKQAKAEFALNDEEAVGQPIAKVIEWPPIDENAVLEVIQQERTLHLGKHELHKNNKIHVSAVSAYPIFMPNGMAAVIQIQDITQQVQTEAETAQADKMTLVGGLAAGMAHELNNPLGGIMQNAQNILRRLNPEIKKNLEVAESCGVSLDAMKKYFDTREITQFLEAINQYGVRAAEIVKHMLQFSGSDSKAKEVSDINALVKRAYDLARADENLKSLFEEDDINIRFELLEDNPSLECNTSEIEQVILSIIKNAVQAIHQKKVDLGAEYKPELVLKTAYQDKFVAIEIDDNGPGMPKNVLSRVFEPFFTTHDIGKGTGLGLAVSYFLVTANHHGQISVESEQGKGSWFKVLLPRQFNQAG